VLDAIFAVTSDILKSPARQQKLEAQGLNVKIETPGVFASASVANAIWRELIRQRSIIGQLELAAGASLNQAPERPQ